jgi:hypothetical protein
LEDYPNISATFYRSNDDVVEMMLSDIQLEYGFYEFFEVKSEKDKYRYMGNWSKYYDFDAGRLTSFE